MARERRRVLVQPAQHELDQRLGLLLARAIALLPARQIAERERLGRARARDAERLERGGVDAVHRDEDLDVVIEHRAPLRLVGRRRQVRAPGRALHHDPARLVTEAVDVRHRDPVRLEHAHHLVLVLERIDAVLLHPAIPAKVDADALAARLLHLEEPRRPPALLLLDRDDATADELFDTGRGAGRDGHGWLRARRGSVA